MHLDEPSATTADLLGIALTKIDFEGGTYEIREPDLEERGLYQRFLEDRARATLARDLDSSEEDRRRDRLAVNLEITAGTFEFDGEVATKWRRTWSGQAKLWEIMFKIDPDKAERMARAKAEEVAELARKAVLDLDPKALGVLMDPLMRTLGLPRDFLSEWYSTNMAPRRRKHSKRGQSPASGPSTVPTAATPTPGNSSPPPDSPEPAAES